MKTLRHYGGSYQARTAAWIEVFRNREPFKAGNLRGFAAVPALPSMLPEPIFGLLTMDAPSGHLPEPYRTYFCRSFMDYIVYSYETPIAWHSPDTGWHLPNVTYSLTTTGHQQAVRVTLNRIGVKHLMMGEAINTRKGRGRAPFGPRNW